MPAATLSIPPSVEHVRTARLVAVAAARRASLDEETVDDVRLAVGEAVARAVLRHGAAELADPIDVVVRDDGRSFEVEVCDASDPSVPDEDSGVALALVEAIVPEVRAEGGAVVLAWPRAVPA
ncbi:MAG: ATP-binding protein [Candidatus Nanopelagicales bacterium]